MSKIKKLSTYVELVEAAMRGEEYDEMKKYIDLALELNVKDSKLWWYKTLAEAKLVIDEKNYTTWIFECGEKSILYAKDKDEAAANIYMIYLDLAIDKLLYMRKWGGEELGEELYPLVLDYEKDVITLFRKIPKAAINKNPKLKEKAKVLSQQWLIHYNIHTGPVSRANYIKQIYFETSPLSEAEKKEEIELFGIDFDKIIKKDDLSKGNEHSGCYILIIIFLIVFLYLFFI